MQAWKRNEKMQAIMDRIMLKMPILVFWSKNRV
jgi:hypothetical protein